MMKLVASEKLPRVLPTKKSERHVHFVFVTLSSPRTDMKNVTVIGENVAFKEDMSEFGGVEGHKAFEEKL